MGNTNTVVEAAPKVIPPLPPPKRFRIDVELWVPLTIVAVGSLSVGYILVRRVRRRYRQSQVLRQAEYHNTADFSALVPGTYVMLKGRVETETPLLSPIKCIPCVQYETVKLRVVDQRTSAVTRSFVGKIPVIGFLFGYGVDALWGIGAYLGFTSEIKQENWGMDFQEVSRSAGTAQGLRLVSGDKSIILDVSGAEMLELEVVCGEFERHIEEGLQDGRRAIGYKTVEKVLKVGTPLIVLGDIGTVADEDGEEKLIVRAPVAQHMLDIKTSSILKPFVVTAMTESELLRTVEHSGRLYFWSAVPCLTIGAYFAACASSHYQRKHNI